MLKRGQHRSQQKEIKKERTALKASAILRMITEAHAPSTQATM
jgi:hypothetical protein